MLIIAIKNNDDNDITMIIITGRSERALSGTKRSGLAPIWLCAVAYGV